MRIDKNYKVLLMGYNGANNTGSEARLITIIEDVRKVLGAEIEITIPTICKDNLSRYIKEGPNLTIVEYPTVYFLTLYQLVMEHDLILLTEGSCYMDTWSAYLLWCWLWVTWCAVRKGKLVVAYAVDSGSLSGLNLKLVRQVASKTNLIITRTGSSADRLKTWRVSAPIETTADTAFGFQPEACDRDFLERIWPESGLGVIGIAPVDFNLWPVRFRLWGSQKNCYRWPYYFSHSRKRSVARKMQIRSYADFADRIIEKHGYVLAFICMEELDEPLARKIQSRMRHAGKTRIISSREYNASQITTVLRSLDLLITSRYHAGVLSVKCAVPQIAIGHDERLRDLYREMGIYDKYFLEYSSAKLFSELEKRVDDLLENPISQVQLLKKNNEIQCNRANKTPTLLNELLKKEGINTNL